MAEGGDQVVSQPRPAEGATLRVRDVGKTFAGDAGTVVALDRVSIDVDAGELASLVAFLDTLRSQK